VRFVWLIAAVNWGVVGAVAGIVGAVVAPIGVYLVAARRMSGKVATSDAAQLWQEAGSIRDDYRAQLLQANERAVSLEIRMAKAETENSECRRENYELRHKVEDLEQMVSSQAETIRSLQALVKAQREELGNGPTEGTT
jgi:chromosome segregation ATPase